MKLELLDLPGYAEFVDYRKEPGVVYLVRLDQPRKHFLYVGRTGQRNPVVEAVYQVVADLFEAYKGECSKVEVLGAQVDGTGCGDACNYRRTVCKELQQLSKEFTLLHRMITRKNSDPIVDGLVGYDGHLLNEATTEPERVKLAEALHNAGLSACTHPVGYSKEEWNDYRLKLADGLIERGIHFECGDACTCARVSDETNRFWDELGDWKPTL